MCEDDLGLLGDFCFYFTCRCLKRRIKENSNHRFLRATRELVEEPPRVDNS